MNKNLLKILSYIGIALIFLLIGFFIGENFNNNIERQEEPKLRSEKISVSTFTIRNNNTDNSISTSDLSINDNLMNTYIEVMNSNIIKNKIKETYSDVKDIELENIKGTGLIKAIYICDRDSEKECIDINNKYISLFANIVEGIYNINILIVDEASISTRVVEE